MVFFFARWLLIAYSSKNEKKKKKIPIKSCQAFFLGGWGGEQAKICASNDINDKFFLVAAHDLETQTFYDLWREFDTYALALFCFL